MSDFSFVIIPVVLSIVITGVILFFVLRYQREQKRKAIGMLEMADGQTMGSAMVEGVEYRWHYYEGSKNNPSFFKVLIDCESEGSFKIAEETGFDKFAERMGINVELKTGDIEFDENYYLTSDHVEFSRMFFDSSKRRQAIREIFGNGFNQVEFDGMEMAAVLSPFKREQPIDDAIVERTAANLIDLIENMPEVPDILGPAGGGWKARRVIAFAVPGLLLVGGVTLLFLSLAKYTPLDPWRLVFSSLKISLPLLVVYLWLALQLLKGRSTSHRELIIVAIISLTAFPLAGAGSKAFLNASLDTGVATAHRAPVVHKYYSISDDDETYYALVESWREPDSTEKITVTSGEYSRIDPGSALITVVTKPGKFGYEWIVQYRIEHYE